MGWFSARSTRMKTTSKTIYLVRHGQKVAEFGDPGLTEEGKQQAKETGIYLQQFPITQIISSPFRRTQETAAEIAHELHLSYTVDDALVERMNWNGNGVSYESFVKEWVVATHNRDYIPAFGDSSRRTGEKIKKLVNNLTATAGAHIVLVTHGGAIVDYLRTVFGDEKLAKIRFQYEEGEDYQMMNCAINKIVYSRGPVLELLNFTAHLRRPSE